MEHIGRGNPDRCRANHCRYKSSHDATSRGDIFKGSASKVQSNRGNCRTCLLAAKHAKKIGLATYIISATTPFTQADLDDLRSDAPAVVKRLFPNYENVYEGLGWKMFPTLDRVYDNSLARMELGWQPKYDFRHIVDCLENGKETRSPLAVTIGSKGYHEETFEHGPYPVEG